MKLIINADDFGISKAINLGIMEGFKNGIVTSTTLMCNMEATEHAVELAKKNPKLGVGIHLVLTAGKPLSKDVKTLVDVDGNFLKYDKIFKSASIDDVRKEFRSQIEKFLSFGIVPTHIDTHHHVHTKKDIFTVVYELAKEINIPVRYIEEIGKDKYKDIRTTTKFIDNFYDLPMIEPKILQKICENNIDIESLEVMCHPGYLDHKIISSSSYAYPRVKELETLTDKEVIRFIKDKNIQLINFKDI
ncbi:hypothetical protein BJV38_004816 [Clostridium beijerinckii]|uniref:chitin disaccharide deacetylase n=1 Tax=Clostridium beijerinckii TaxID=1520 RepID=UPI00156DD725|nr:chitin disaccharide deacetylase [Clostridium beijerinckii]NRT32599.1 hypothetical protein [Clostridium beijerinckii]NRT47973.1 hypothetical protein [Clostridium beijerinckii]NRZ23730.1 hypothetical protein [Clostridium beijerinckii]